jgi:hypothetical protein
MPPRPLLPPRGVFVPTPLAYHRDLSSAAFHTWVQLYGLAWGKNETPALSLIQISELTGKSTSTIYGHMALLRSRGALRWRSSGKGTFIVTFDLPDAPEFQESGIRADAGTATLQDSGIKFQESGKIFQDSGEQPPDSKNLESSSLSSPLFSNDSNLEDEEREGEFQEFGKTFQKSGIQENNLAIHRQEGERGDPESVQSVSQSAVSDPIALYRNATQLRPNQPQRKKILAVVTDLTLWQDTLDHWQTHSWNPKNIPGLLDLYQRGGPAACIYCQQASKTSAFSRTGSHPHNPTLDVIEKMKKEIKERERKYREPDS